MRLCCLGISASRLRAAPVASHKALPHTSDYTRKVNKLEKKQPYAAGYYQEV